MSFSKALFAITRERRRGRSEGRRRAIKRLSGVPMKANQFRKSQKRESPAHGGRILEGKEGSGHPV